MGKMKGIVIDRYRSARIPAVQVRIICKNCGHSQTITVPFGVPTKQYAAYCYMCCPPTEEEIEVYEGD